MPTGECADVHAHEEVLMPRVRLVPSLVAVMAVLLGSTAASAGASARATAKGATVVVTTRKVGKLGTILVDSRGFTLYMFPPDKRKRVTCVSTCAAIWPPLMLPAGAKVVAKGHVKQSLLGSDPDPAGGRVVTYNGWPLYTYVADSKPGMATGQAVNLNGGLWFVMAPSGAVIKTKAAT